MSNGVGLYYPPIEIRDSNWLKLSVLYWDKLRRIVPEAVRPADSEDVRMAAEAGLVVDTSPEPYIGDVAEMLQSKLSALLLDMTRDDVQQLREFANESTLRPQFYSTLHHEKISDAFVTQLVQLGLARVDDEWLGMDRSFLAIYMTELAMTMSRRIQAPLVTNSSSYASLVNASAFGRRWKNMVGGAQNPGPDEMTAVLEMSVGFPSVASVAGCSMTSILASRKRHLDEMREFRASIEELLSGLGGCEDRNAIADLLNEKSRQLKASQRELQRGLREFGIDALSSALKFVLKGTAVLATATTIAHAPLGVAVGLGAVLCGVQTFQKFRHDRDDSPYRYLRTLQHLRPT